MTSSDEGPGDRSPAPTFPDRPKLELDELLRQLIGRAEDVVATQSRLRGLVRVNQSIVGNLDLPEVLRRIVEVACESCTARYGALGVLDASGGLEQFVHVGMDDVTVTRIGRLPEGKGLLGALIEHPQPIRLPTMSDDLRSVGLPDGHPPMSSFLGVPIRVRDKVFGSLYLSECASGEFTAEDEELVSALAGTAGVVLENARLHEAAGRQQSWLEASAEVSQQLLSADGEDPLHLIARLAHRIADADVVTVALPTADGQRMIIEVACGEAAEQLTAFTFPIKHSYAGAALRSGRPALVADVADDPLRRRDHLSLVVPVGPLMVLPLGSKQRVRGALVIGRLREGHGFTQADLEMALAFAHHAAIALELADSRADQQRILLLEDHQRIARDLHDHVTQRLFALGLTVQSVANVLAADPRASRLSQVVADIDETIRQTRTSIFQLRGPLGPETGTVRARLLIVAEEVSPLLGFEPLVDFTGPIDALVPESVSDDLVAVLREGLTNTARHARASRVVVEVAATTSEVRLDVSDDGVGLSDTQRRSGLANLRQRAEIHGGTLTLASAAWAAPTTRAGGTRLTWTIPLV